MLKKKKNFKNDSQTQISNDLRDQQHKKNEGIDQIDIHFASQFVIAKGQPRSERLHPKRIKNQTKTQKKGGERDR